MKKKIEFLKFLKKSANKDIHNKLTKRINELNQSIKRTSEKKKQIAK